MVTCANTATKDRRLGAATDTVSLSCRRKVGSVPVHSADMYSSEK